jgi:hypothetical protein
LQFAEALAVVARDHQTAVPEGFAVAHAVQLRILAPPLLAGVRVEAEDEGRGPVEDDVAVVGPDDDQGAVDHPCLEQREGFGGGGAPPDVPGLDFARDEFLAVADPSRGERRAVLIRGDEQVSRGHDHVETGVHRFGPPEAGEVTGALTHRFGTRRWRSWWLTTDAFERFLVRGLDPDVGHVR